MSKRRIMLMEKQNISFLGSSILAYCWCYYDIVSLFTSAFVRRQAEMDNDIFQY